MRAVGDGAQRRARGGRVFRGLERIFSAACFGEDFCRRRACHMERLGETRRIGAKEGVGGFFPIHARGNGRHIFSARRVYRRLARSHRFVIRRQRQGEGGVGGAVFVGAIDDRLIGEAAQFGERLPHLLRRSFKESSAAHDEERIADEEDLFFGEVVGDMAGGMAWDF